MDRNYYYEKMAKQRERELSQKAATHRLLNSANEELNTSKRVKRLVLRFAPIIIFLILIFFHFFS